MTHSTHIHVLNLEEVALRCGVDEALVTALVELGAIEAHAGEVMVFSCEVTLQVGRVARLQRDLGVNLEGAAVIVDLLERIDALEHELRVLRRR